MSRSTMTAMTSAVIAAALIAMTGCRRFDRMGGTGWAQYEASYVHRRTPAEDAPAAGDGVGYGGLRMRALVGKGALGYLAGLDLHGGMTWRPGFAYQADLYLLGAGLRLGERGAFAIGAGVGASGATGTMDDAVELPVEASLNLALGSRLRLMARGRAVWLGNADARQHGAPSFDRAGLDELDGTFALRWSKSYREHGFPSGNGYFTGVALRESEGATFLGLVIGYGVDASTPRRHRDGDDW